MAMLSLPVWDRTNPNLSDAIIDWFRHASNLYLHEGGESIIQLIDMELEHLVDRCMDMQDTGSDCIHADIAAWLEKLARWCKQERPTYVMGMSRKQRLAIRIRVNVSRIWELLPQDKLVWACNKHEISFREKLF